jgi:hypothetical protein
MIGWQKMSSFPSYDLQKFLCAYFSAHRKAMWVSGEPP